VYNYFLNQRKTEYLNSKKSLTYNKQSASLTQLKKQDDTNWLTEINAQSLQYSLKCLDQAFQRFFKKTAAFPKFKSRRNKNSFTIPQNYSVTGGLLFLPKLKDGIAIIQERKIEGIIKKCSISKTPTGKYFVCILAEQNYIPVTKTNKSVGIDLGLKDFLVLSDGSKIKNQKFLKNYEKLLKTFQQSLARKIKGSNNYNKNKLKLAKIYEKITNSRTDFIHKTTKKLIEDFDVIYIEDLNIKGMMKNHKLSKAIGEVSWGQFLDTLQYKAVWNDKQVINIGRFFPSSKTCSSCGWIKQDLKLKDRSWVCPQCGTTHDRDVNAAKNILTEGSRLKIFSDAEILLSVGTTDYECGDKIRLSFSNENSTVSEAFKEMETRFPETA
jgi:putative transposase